MKSPIAVLRGWWRKRKERRKRGAEKGGASKPVRAGEGRTIEPLEGRIAPATLLDPSTLVYHDLDGDTVTVRFSKPLFDQPAAVLNTLLNSVFIFSAGDAHSGTDTPQQLQLIDLTKVPKAGAIDRVSGTSLTITAEPGAGGGNGLADIGAIEASGLTFKRITIDGDLGQIDCGNAVVTTSLRALDVVTLGAKGLTTQTPVAGTGADAEADRADKLESRIVGGVGAVSASGDFQGYLHVVHGTQFVGSQNVISAPGKIGRIEIAGSLKGAPEIVAESNNTALIETAGDIGTALIGTDTSEGIVGGGGTNSGAIICGGDLKNLEVSGSILGGGGANSGRVAATKALGSVVIGNDLVGGDGAGSGVIHSTQTTRALLVGDDVIAGKGPRTGVVSSDGSIGTVTVRGDLLGTVLGNLEGAGARSGGISAAGDINFVTVNGNVVGGTETLTGFIESHAAVKKVTINGSLIGGRGLSSGIVATGGSLDDITVLGALSGGAGDNSGSILVGTDPNQPGALSRVKVDGDFLSGPGGTTLGAALFGGSGDNSGMIRAGGSIGKMFLGNAAITTTLLGGAGHFSGAIFSDAGIASIDLVRASGGDGDYSASITAHGLVQKAAVTLAGGAGSGSGSLRALDLITADREIGGRIGSFRGAATGGAGELSGSVWSDGGAGEIIGVFTAGAGARSGSLTTGAGLTSDGDVQTIEINANGAASVRPSIQVNGSIGKVEAGSLSETDLHVSGAIGAMQVTGSLRDVLLTVGAIGSEGRPATAVLGKLTVGGNVERSQILAGFDLEREPVNPDAVIGKVQIGGNWVASDLVAGARDVDQNGFGNEDDRPIGIGAADLQARIAQIVVRGTVTGTADSATDHYGFVSEQIGSVSINGVRVVLDSIAADLKSLDSTNNDLFLREVRTV